VAGTSSEDDDRLLITQALEENIPMRTSDEVMIKYAVQTVWQLASFYR
jgi:PIN domain nuclease of toxin-antitoxin system